jgi:hypothetical protein
MTAIPAALAIDSDDQAILLTFERLRTHALTPAEAEKDLILLFDAEVDRAQVPLLTKYIADMSERIGKGKLEPQDAASDLGN